MPRLSVTRGNLRLIRAALRLYSPPAHRGTDIAVLDQTDSNLRLRVYQPKAHGPKGALLWMHGGGLIIGKPSLDDVRCVRFARELDILVVSPDYRLAPEHPFPAAHDDCYQAWAWTVKQAANYGIDSSRLAIGGESAGGGLAASLAHRIHDGGHEGPGAQLLVYPMLDDRTAARQDIGETEHVVWNRRSNRTGWSSYLRAQPATGSVAEYAVPARRQDLSGLPPAWIGVGTLDLFYEEDRSYAARLQAAGNRCDLHVVEGAFHGFQSVLPRSPVSVAFAKAQAEFLRKRLGL